MKHVQQREITLTVKKDHLDDGRFGLLGKTRDMARKALGKNIAISKIETSVEFLSDGLRHDVVKITWKVDG